MADTTPDTSHHEQVSICVRIVNLNGHVSEHLLACQRAPGTNAEDLYGVIMSVLQFRDVSFDRLIAQAYDGASNMSGFKGQDCVWYQLQKDKRKTPTVHEQDLTLDKALHTCRAELKSMDDDVADTVVHSLKSKH
eukprot:Em0011g1082a